MKRFLSLAAALVIVLAADAAHAGTNFLITNLTLSGGGNPALADPAYPVLDDLTFTGLNLQLNYADGTVLNTPLGSLDTLTTTLNTSMFANPGVHGLITDAVLTGSVDKFTGISVVDSMQNAVTGITFSNNGAFTADFARDFGGNATNAILTGQRVNILVGDASAEGVNYAIGTLGSVSAPEPGTLALIIIAGVPLAGAVRRLHRA